MSLLRSAARPTPRALARAFSTTPPSQLAKMTLIGRLAMDPEPTVTSTSKEIVRYAVATGYGSKVNRQTSYFRVTSFEEGPRRDFLLGLTKGTLIYVEGDATLRAYDDSDGKRQTSLSMIQRRLEVLKRQEPQLEEQQSGPQLEEQQSGLQSEEQQSGLQSEEQQS